MAFTYMLLCADGSYYVGSTRNLDLRLHQHQLGMGSEYTRHRLPVELVWFEEHEHVGAAFSREKQIQRWGRAKREALIRQDYAGLEGMGPSAYRRLEGRGRADG